MQQRKGDELFTNKGKRLTHSLCDFWGWYASSLLHGALRGALAEYIVCLALDVPTDECRQDWEPYDMLFHNQRIEVKSSAYYQRREQEKPSRISFDIAKRTRWDPDTKWSISAHNSDVYIFCVLGDPGDPGVDPMDVGEWSFYILRTEAIDETLGNQRTLSLKTLLSMNPLRSSYDDLKGNVESLL